MTFVRTRWDGGPVADDERERPPAAPAPAASILDMQRGAGNAAVARWLRADSASGSSGAAPAAEPYWPEPGYTGVEEDVEGDEAAEAETGSIEDIEGQEIDTAGCDRPDGAGAPLRVRTNLTIVSAVGDAPAAPRKSDAVASALNMGSKVKKGGASPGGGEFGVEKVKYKVDSMTFTRNKATSTVNATARVFLDIGWGVHSLGRTNIPNENVKAVKKSTYQKIRDDLKPDGSGRPDRKKYWAKDLTEKHEQFHASDDIQRAQAYIPTATAWLDTQTVRANKIKKDLKAHLQTVRSNVEADGWAWYGVGGEDRAYADGKASYQARADAMDARATKEGW